MLLGFQHGGRLVLCVAQVGNRTKGFVRVVLGAGVHQHIAAGEPHFHLQHVFPFDVEALGHEGDFGVTQGVAVGAGLIQGVGLETLFHGAQVEEQLALGLGGGHLDHAPVFQNVFMDLGLDPVHGIAHQAHPLVGVKAFDGLHQAQIAFLDQVTVGQAITQVLA